METHNYYLSSDTMRDHCQEVFLAVRKNLTNIFKKENQKVTAHWIDNDWNLHDITLAAYHSQADSFAHVINLVAKAGILALGQTFDDSQEDFEIGNHQLINRSRNSRCALLLRPAYESYIANKNNVEHLGLRPEEWQLVKVIIELKSYQQAITTNNIYIILPILDPRIKLPVYESNNIFEEEYIYELLNQLAEEYLVYTSKNATNINSNINPPQAKEASASGALICKIFMKRKISSLSEEISQYLTSE
ncbi:hypothetical protein BY996DRAFT_6504702 [Phakopsora pachyrhizi]|nr:hypothetical protein BY996DRAFT_6504702 [Phakopsora pachyrhizi]